MSATDPPSRPPRPDPSLRPAPAPPDRHRPLPAVVPVPLQATVQLSCPHETDPAKRCACLQLVAELRATIDQLQQRTAVDHLTGVATRAILEQVGGRELGRLLRYGHPVSLVYCDIDHFKQVNDRHGHAVGDQVLRAFALCLQQAARRVDLVARIGGEEFVMLLPNTGRTGARLTAEKLRSLLAQTRFPVVGQLTASFGIAQAAVAEEWSEWVGRADAAMYEAKLGGRDRVVVAETPRAIEPVESVASGFLHLVWREAYASGNATIDRQHRALFVAANEFLGASAAGDQQGASELLALLLDDCRRHFADEERILRAVGYDGVASHAAVHADLLQRAVALNDGFTQGNVEVGAVVTFLTRDLVAGHMLRDDRAHFPLLR